MILLQTITD